MPLVYWRERMQAAEASFKANAAATHGPVCMGAESRTGSGLLKAVSDGHSRKIMESVVSRGRTVEEICSVTGIPISTAYRRVHEMTDEGLIICERIVVTGAGKKYAVYRAAFSSVMIRCEGGSCMVEGAPNEGVPDIMYRLWQFQTRPATRDGLAGKEDAW